MTVLTGLSYCRGMETTDSQVGRAVHGFMWDRRITGRAMAAELDKERWVAVHPDVERVVMRARGFVFPSCSATGHVQGATVSRWLGEALPSPWTAHCLRHSFATELYAATHDLVLVAQQLGHESTRTTERYVRPNSERAARAVAALTLVA